MLCKSVDFSPWVQAGIKSRHIWPPRYTTFNKVYQKRWKDVLRFRDRSLFTVCEVCQTLKADLSDKGLSFDQKLGALQLYRAHLHDQFCDRTVCWRLQSESADPSTDVLAICTDGLDQAKFSLPRDPQLRASAALLPGCIGNIFPIPQKQYCVNITEQEITSWDLFIDLPFSLPVNHMHPGQNTYDLA